MSLQFIIGGSGSGKTRTLYENLIRQSMEEPDGRFFALVPEQFTGTQNIQYDKKDSQNDDNN